MLFKLDGGIEHLLVDEAQDTSPEQWDVIKALTEAGIQVLPVMVALGNWGLAHRDGERRLRVRAELLRDAGPELVTAMMDELRELHLGIPRPDPDAPRASDQLRAAYEATLDGARA